MKVLFVHAVMFDQILSSHSYKLAHLIDETVSVGDSVKVLPCGCSRALADSIGVKRYISHISIDEVFNDDFAIATLTLVSIPVILAC